MKKYYVLAILLVFTMIVSVDTIACGGWHWGGGGGHGGGGDTGAPLDGGLLAILAAAGITYFTARKRKKNKNAE